jgi:putative transposase
MPRKPRAEEAGAAHHAFSRGNRRRDIFHDDGDRQVFLVVLKGVVECYGWELLAYCLMRNHFHLVVRTPLPNLGEGMQRLLGSYARYFNGRYGESGHVFKRPFKSERIKDDVHLAVAIAYVAENPVAAGLCESALDWRWSGHGTRPDLHRASLRMKPCPP